MEDWLDKLRTDGRESVWLELQAGKMLSKDGKQVRGHKLFHAWLRQLMAATWDHPIKGYIVATDVVIEVFPIAREEAMHNLQSLLACWLKGMDAPLPLACKTALAYLEAERSGKDAHKAAAETYEGERNPQPEGREPCLARQWPTFDALSAEAEWLHWSRALYGPYTEWLSSGIEKLPLESSQPPGEEADPEQGVA